MGACDEKCEGGKATAMGIRVAGDEEGEGGEAGNGVGDEGGVQLREFGGKSNGNEVGRRLTAIRAMATATATWWMMVMVTRLAANEEGKGEGGKGDGDGDDGGRRQATTREWRQRQEQWRQRQWWRASDGDGNEEGDDDGEADNGGQG